ncbi:MAG: HAD-IA family hydrolase [Anaerolineae bacterium]|nr:HAD-IA family hydrolase [Anaerolineae bacterium]
MLSNTLNPFLAAGIPFPKAVLWDMDGVICDNGHLHYASWKQAFAEFPQYSFSEEFFVRTFGMNNFGVLTLLLEREPTPDEVEQIAGEKERIFREMIVGNITFLPGVEEWLRTLKQWGVPQAIASSAPRDNIVAFRQELHLDDYLDVYISAQDMPSKPDPAVFLAAAEALSVSPQDCLVVEDATAGVAAGAAGGMRVLAVTTTNPRERLTLANLVVDTLAEIDLAAWRGSGAG